MTGMMTDCRLNKADPVLAAVSGGADSLALLHFLHSRHYPLVVAHFDHQLRPDSAADEAHVRALAAELGLPYVSAAENVAAHAQAARLSVEEAARELRYRFLFQAARQAGAQAVATGHTADDQAETVLMHFLRGAGLAGLKGMPPRSFLPVFDETIALVRPLLDWTRAETEAYCQKHALLYRIDASNADTAYLRNQLRHELLPQLTKYNPQIRHTLAKTAQALQGDAQLLAELVDLAWEKAIYAAGNGFLAFDRIELNAMSLALRRNLLRKAAFTLKPALRDVDFAALERAAHLKAMDVAGGLKIRVEGPLLYLTEHESTLPVIVPQLDGEWAVFEGEQALGNGWSLKAELLSDKLAPLPTDNWSAVLDADLVGNRLRLRALRPGDRFQPLGMPGKSIKLSDLFVNLKIPHRLRKKWPLVWVDDEIAWIPGLRLAEAFKVSEATRRVWKLSLRKV